MGIFIDFALAICCDRMSNVRARETFDRWTLFRRIDHGYRTHSRIFRFFFNREAVISSTRHCPTYNYSSIGVSRCPLACDIDALVLKYWSI